MAESRFESLNLANLSFIEHLYSQYLEDKSSVDLSWHYFFEGMAFAGAVAGAVTGAAGSVSPTEESVDPRIFHLIQAYRMHGHKAAHINPIRTQVVKPSEVEELKLSTLHFRQEELQKSFPTCGFLLKRHASLDTLIKALEKTYCGSVGFEFCALQNRELKEWLQEKIAHFFPIQLDRREKKEILHALNRSEMIESFINMKYPGQKRFSLEGEETLIPILEAIIDQGGEEGVEEIIFGMAHRGRLNVLANILGKPYSLIFHEFESGFIPDSVEGSGDVKYHMGYEGEFCTRGGKQVHLTLCDNPSHLESIDPVVEGRARAKQEIKYRKQPQAILPILIHGDAAIAGQGVVYETLQLSQLNGYETRGTIHIVVNNHVGFTATPQEYKSTRYCTDIARSFGLPIFHVNAEEVESCVAVAKLAVQIRQRFGCDVMIEVNGYRKYGHNETDEPSFTQPLIYKMIKKKEKICVLYRDHLIQEGSLSREEGEEEESLFSKSLERALEEAKALAQEKKEIQIEPKQEESLLFEPVQTAVPLERLKDLTHTFCKIPDGFHLHPKLNRIFNNRLKMLEGDPQGAVIDWGMGEYLAYATLLTEGIPVRLSGQDSGRGTFSHRHALLTDQETEERYAPLSHLSPDQARFCVYNSPLSEYGVMGFEYGYSLGCQKGLVIWEAQFGDFSNGAQIIIDQYVSSSEQKWRHPSSLTLLLPHGYEGQGPEHSSARIERFLQLAGNDSMFITIPTTPAQLFHLLRRQSVGNFQKPLVVFTSKELLRYSPSLSSPHAFEQGTFQEVIDDPHPPSSVRRLLFCAGKVYYNLLEKQEKGEGEGVVVIRVEQLYPFPEARMRQILSRYKGAKTFYWVQEEHANMGAWEFIHPYIEKLLPQKQILRYVGRGRSASPAAGSRALHQYELKIFLEEAFG